MKPKAVLVLSLSVVTFGAGCGSSFPPPNDSWAAAQGEVGRAQAGGALDVPDAKLHLQLAQEDLQSARELIGKDNQRSASLCVLASTEAELAVSLAQQAAAQDRALRSESELHSPAEK
jgi:hypothetical protein